MSVRLKLEGDPKSVAYVEMTLEAVGVSGITTIKVNHVIDIRKVAKLFASLTDKFLIEAPEASVLSGTLTHLRDEDDPRSIFAPFSEN